MKKEKDPVLESELRRLRKRSAVIRLIVSALIAFQCALDYKSDFTLVRNVAHGNILDFILPYIIIDSVIVLGWIASKAIMFGHFVLHVALLVYIFINIFINFLSDIEFTAFLYLPLIWFIWFGISLFILMPFILYYIGSKHAHESII